jgi:hypothetical protein
LCQLTDTVYCLSKPDHDIVNNTNKKYLERPVVILGVLFKITLFKDKFLNHKYFNTKVYHDELCEENTNCSSYIMNW